jgi:probable H4MPT-linked C1 transfer pathway protein
LGLDIGGANTKATLIEYSNSNKFHSYSYVEYFPFWEQSLKEIPKMLNRIINQLVIRNGYSMKIIDNIAITITAELSDAFQTKSEGVITILNALEQVFDKSKLIFMSNTNIYLNFDKAKEAYNSVAAANWVATSLFLGNYVSKCILIDAGSTTIDIIPIQNSSPVTLGKTDIERMLNHELIYTGGLRATIPSITHFVPYKGKMVRISFEKFALISDVHRILNNISEDEYICDTADNRSKALADCYARLSRIICMDINLISREELNIIASFIYRKQLKIIESEITQFMQHLMVRKPEIAKSPHFIITGLSADFLVKEVLVALGYNKISSYEEITKISDNISSSAFAVAGAYYFQSMKS